MPVITWTDQTVSFGDFAAQVEAGLIDLDPAHQRGVVHDRAWMSDVLHSGLFEGDIPEVYFHHRKGRGGAEIRESLDGKQRCSAVVDYLNDLYAYTSAEPADMTGRKFSELTEAQQNELRYQCTLRLRIAQQTLTNEQIQRFFQKRQMAKRTTTGEHLNSCITSPLLKPFRDLLAEPDTQAHIRTLARNNKRDSDLEIITRIARCYQQDEKVDCSPIVLIGWFTTEGVEDDLVPMCDLVRKTLELLAESQLKAKGSKANYLAVAQHIVTSCLEQEEEDEDGGLAFDENEIDALRETITGGVLDLSADNGEKGATARAGVNLGRFVEEYQEGVIEYST